MSMSVCTEMLLIERLCAIMFNNIPIRELASLVNIQNRLNSYQQQQIMSGKL